MRFVEIVPFTPSGMLALIASPESDAAGAPILLFLHGKGEAGSSQNALPLVFLHQTPPFQAILGRIPGAYVVTPQAPAKPDIDSWNWRDHLPDLASRLRARFPGRRILACGFSRGGLGVLQLLAAHPDLIDAWAVVDPQPTDGAERDAILKCSKIGQGWLRYGRYRAGREAFAAALEAKVLELHRGIADLDHTELALRAFNGDSLSAPPGQNLYQFLGLQFRADA